MIYTVNILDAGAINLLKELEKLNLIRLLVPFQAERTIDFTGEVSPVTEQLNAYYKNHPSKIDEDHQAFNESLFAKEDW